MIRFFLLWSALLIGWTTSIVGTSLADPIHDAAKTGDFDRAKGLIAEGVNIEAEDRFGLTPRKWAESRGHLAIATLLVATGAKNDQGVRDVDQFASKNKIPIEEARQIFWKLAHRQRQLDRQLFDAAQRRDLDLAKELLAQRADAGAKHDHGRTPLHNAATIGDRVLAELLLENGADVDAVDYSNSTPLHYAVFTDHKDIVELLVDKYADVNVKSKNGTTPLKTAKDKGSAELVVILERHGARE